MKLMEKKEIYREWLKTQKEKADKAFVSEITGVVPANNEVEYLHKLYVGGSTDAVILGVSPFATPNDAYNTMLDMTKQEDRFIFRYGHFMEKFIAEEFERITRLKVYKGLTLFDKEREWSMAQIDFVLEDDTPLEIKTAFMNTKDSDGEKKWGKGCEFNINGELLFADDKIPVYYFIQCQKQLYLADKDFMYLACLISAEVGIRIYKIERNEEIIKKIISAEDDFIFNHVIPEKPYLEKEIKGLDSVDEHPSSCYATCDFIELVKEMNKLQAEKIEISKKVDAFSDAIREYLGEHQEAVDSKGKLVIKQTKQTRLSLDTAALKNDHADIVSQYYVEKPIASKLTINKKYFD